MCSIHFEGVKVQHICTYNTSVLLHACTYPPHTYQLESVQQSNGESSLSVVATEEGETGQDQEEGTDPVENGSVFKAEREINTIVAGSRI